MNRQDAPAKSGALLSRLSILPDIQRRDLRDAFLAGVGGALAIGALGALMTLSAIPLIAPPFGASCVLLFALPASPLAQPRNVIGGHLLSALTGLVMLSLFGASLTSMALAVGLAIALMRLTGTLHPPAGANPIVVMLLQPSWWFLAAPIGVGAILLVLIARAYHFAARLRR